MADELPEKVRAEDQLLADIETDGLYNVLNAALYDGDLERVGLMKRAIKAGLAIEESTREKDREIAELQRLVYVPGVWKCAKCSLRLVSSNLHADSGKISANNDPQPCANGCGPMWRVTERDAGNDLCARLDKSATEIVELRERLERAQGALRECPGITGDYSVCWPDKHALAIREAKDSAHD